MLTGAPRADPEEKRAGVGERRCGGHPDGPPAPDAPAPGVAAAFRRPRPLARRADLPAAPLPDPRSRAQSPSPHGPRLPSSLGREPGGHRAATSPRTARTPGQAAPAAPPSPSLRRRHQTRRRGGSGPALRMRHPRKSPASGREPDPRPRAGSPFCLLQPRPAQEPLSQCLSFRQSRGKVRKQSDFRLVWLQTQDAPLLSPAEGEPATGDTHAHPPGSSNGLHDRPGRALGGACALRVPRPSEEALRRRGAVQCPRDLGRF